MKTQLFKPEPVKNLLDRLFYTSYATQRDNGMTADQCKLIYGDADRMAKMYETEKCDLYNLSGCCNAPFWLESDVCSACKEHASNCCADCGSYRICVNDNKYIND